MTKAIIRFPVTFLFLIAIAAINAVSIENQHDYSKMILALVFGVFCSIVAQVLYERFIKRVILRLLLMLATCALAVSYYLVILPVPKINTVIGIRTAVALFALLIAFIWIPSIRRNADFNDVFMIVFKSIFTSAFFSAVIWGGISLIIVAIDKLLFKVGNNAHIHAANIIWVIWAPMFLLSMIPIFNGSEKEKEKAQRASYCPKFLEVLISYVLIPLTAVYTLVLILYITKTITGSNWNNNILEPLILYYCLTVLLLYILSSGLKNRFVNIFRLVFPKLLVPVAIFQIISSSIIVYTDGIIHTRYFVLIFGLYSVICGVLLSIIPVKKNGIIAVFAIVIALVSITTPVDAFTVSRRSQTMLLQDTLQKNKMIKDNDIIPNSKIAEKDKTIITKSVEYLNNIGELSGINYLPDKFDVYSDFEKTFGFQFYESNPYNFTTMKDFYIDTNQPFEIGGYEFLTNAYLDIPNQMQNNKLSSITKSGKIYNITFKTQDNDGIIEITDPNNTVILSAELKPMIDNISKNNISTGKDPLPLDKMSFDIENENAKLRIIFQNITINYSNTGMTCYANIYILVQLNDQ